MTENIDNKIMNFELNLIPEEAFFFYKILLKKKKKYEDNLKVFDKELYRKHDDEIYKDGVKKTIKIIEKSIKQTEKLMGVLWGRLNKEKA